METRTITQVKIYTLTLNPIMNRAEDRRVVALSSDYDRLIAWYRDQMVPEWRDGQWYKYFRQGSPLEWYNPPRTLELNELQPWGHGIADVWINADGWPALRSSSWYTIID